LDEVFVENVQRGNAAFGKEFLYACFAHGTFIVKMVDGIERIFIGKVNRIAGLVVGTCHSPDWIARHHETARRTLLRRVMKMWR
jgi:hypothetical protein